MSSTSKPTFLLVPGAWHSSEYYNAVEERLKATGYTCVSVQLTSVDPASPSDAFDGDVRVINHAAKEILDNGNNCIFVCHSYGGIVGSESVKGLDKATRAAEGKSTSVVALCFLCAFVIDQGESLWDAIGQREAPWWDVRGEILLAKTPVETFYNDLSSEEANKWTARLKPQALSSFKTPLKYAGWRHVPSFYLVCENDQAIPLFAQEAMLARTNNLVKITRCSASHSPHASQPDVVVRFLREAAGESL